MYPRAFAYARPETLDEALELLREYGEDARPLAGGMSLIPLMKLRLASPAVVVDIGRLEALRGLAVEDGIVRIGACVRHAEVEEDPRIRVRLPLAHDCAGHIGDVQVRNAGTVGGSVAEADPSGDWGPALIALGAEIVCRSRDGERRIPAENFFVGPYTTALAPGELVTAVRIPTPSSGSTGAHLKHERRTGDFGLAIVSVQLRLDPGGRCTDARVALAAVGLVPLRVQAAENALRNARPDGRALEAAAEAVHAAVGEPLADVKAPGDYRRDVARSLVRRAVRAAVSRAQGGDAR